MLAPAAAHARASALPMRRPAPVMRIFLSRNGRSLILGVTPSFGILSSLFPASYTPIVFAGIRNIVNALRAKASSPRCPMCPFQINHIVMHVFLTPFFIGDKIFSIGGFRDSAV